jgi:hypothetical protein
MKKKLVIVNLSLMVAVLFSILFQSFHSYEHLAKQFAEKQCHHHYNFGKTEFTHPHADFDHCFVCEFTLSSFVAPESFTLKTQTEQAKIPYFFNTTEASESFSGSSYSLRGPPYFIV